MQPLTGELACINKIERDALKVYAVTLIYLMRVSFPHEGQIEVHPKPDRKGGTDYDVCLRLPVRPAVDKAKELVARLTDAIPSELRGRLAGCVTWDNEA